MIYIYKPPKFWQFETERHFMWYFRSQLDNLNEIRNLPPRSAKLDFMKWSLACKEQIAEGAFHKLRGQLRGEGLTK